MDQSKPHIAALQVPQVLHMNGGEGDNSYAKNSLLQEKVIMEAKPILQQSISELYTKNSPDYIRVADMGCSSGPNTLLPTWIIIEALEAAGRRLADRKPPTALQVFLNDLPGNDFNTIFKSLLPSFYERLKKENGPSFGPCFIAAVPGSFYDRLFPSHSLHFVSSSYSLHWLSQIPEGLVSDSGIPLNKGNVYIAKTSPPGVHKAYLDQFETDFKTFLSLRSEELKPGGRMVLTLIGSSHNNIDESSDGYCPILWELAGIALNEMVSEGIIEESKLDSFDMPFYAPTAEEVKRVIEKEGSFDIHSLQTFKLGWDSHIEDSDQNGLELSKKARGMSVANRSRSIGEPLLSSHFGDDIIDDLFLRFANKVTGYLEMGRGAYTNVLISITKKS